VVHERIFAVEIAADGEPKLREPSLISDFTPAGCAGRTACTRRAATRKTPPGWLHQQALTPFSRRRRAATDSQEVIAVQGTRRSCLSRSCFSVRMKKSALPPPRFERQVGGAEGRVAQAESRHAELLLRTRSAVAWTRPQRSFDPSVSRRACECLVLAAPTTRDRLKSAFAAEL